MTNMIDIHAAPTMAANQPDVSVAAGIPAKGSTTRPTPLALSRRQAAALLRIDRGATLDALIRRGLLREVPWGRGTRIPLADVRRLADTGFTLRRRSAPKIGRESNVCDPAALRRLDVGALKTG